MRCWKYMNIILAVLGVVLILIFNKRYIDILATNDTLNGSSVFQLIVTDLYLCVTFLFLLCDFTKKRWISLLGLVFMLGSVVYTYIFIFAPMLKTSINLPDSAGENFALTISVKLFGALMILLLVAQYLYKKNKTNIFWQKNIFLLPVIEFLANVKWFNSLKGTEYINYFIQYFKEHIWMIVICILVALVLFLRYKNISNIDI